MKDPNKFYLEGKIVLQDETPELKELASKAIELPPESERQPDLMYMSAILVSSGENLNHAYFLPSELLAAEKSISFKALDIEHSETDIVGSILSREFVDNSGNKLDLIDLASKEMANLNEMDMHIAISAVVYKNRFPKLAKEISDGKWDSVSMECYYQSYDVKVGDVFLSINEAQALGLANVEGSIGKMAKILKAGKEIAAGKLARVLRKICFSGCGVVKNPANPNSKIIEIANNKNTVSNEDIVIMDYDKINLESSNTEEVIDNNVTSEFIEDKEVEIAIDIDDFGNICSYYKHKIFDENNNLVKEHWCAAYKKDCTSFSRGISDPDCLRNKNIQDLVVARFAELHEKSSAKDKREQLLDALEAALREAVKTRSR